MSHLRGAGAVGAFIWVCVLFEVGTVPPLEANWKTVCIFFGGVPYFDSEGEPTFQLWIFESARDRSGACKLFQK